MDMARKPIRGRRRVTLRRVPGWYPAPTQRRPLERFIGDFTRQAQRITGDSAMRRVVRTFERDPRGLREALAFMSDMRTQYAGIRTRMSLNERRTFAHREEMRRTLDRELLTKFFAVSNPRTLERYLNVAHTLAEDVGAMQRTVDNLLRDYEQGELRQLAFATRTNIERALSPSLVKKIRPEFKDFFTDASLIVRAAKDRDQRLLGRFEKKYSALRKIRGLKGLAFYDNPNNWLQLLAVSHIAKDFTKAEQRSVYKILGTLPAYCNAKVAQSLGHESARLFFDMRSAFWEFVELP